MTNHKGFVSFLRSALPPGQREKNLQQLSALIDPEHMQEVRALLAVGPANWSRLYPPSAAIAGQAREVLVGCFDGLLRIAYQPLENLDG